MNRTRTLTALTLVIAALTVASPVRADTPPTKPKEYILTDDNIREKLEEVGFEYVKELKETGATFHYFNVRSNGTDYQLWGSLSRNKEVFWINVELIKITATAGHDERLLKLLELNQENGMVFFKYVAQHQMLTMTRGIENKAVTNRELRAKVESVLSTGLATSKDWNIDWSKPPVTSAPTTAAK